MLDAHGAEVSLLQKARRFKCNLTVTAEPWGPAHLTSSEGGSANLTAAGGSLHLPFSPLVPLGLKLHTSPSLTPTFPPNSHGEIRKRLRVGS